MPAVAPIALLLWLAALAAPAGATVLYKSVAPNGVVMFSDTPPDNTDRVERIPMTFSGPSSGYTSSGAAPVQVAAARFDELKSFDQAVAEANARVDQAEAALAAARRSTLSPLEGLRLAANRPGPDDASRVESARRDVLLARQSLLETLRARNQR
jgi:hypothetical protein